MAGKGKKKGLKAFGYSPGKSRRKRKKALRLAAKELGLGRTHRLLQQRQKNASKKAQNVLGNLEEDENFLELNADKLI
ncbi:MAG: hypothetical protein SVS85_04255 [Candidatus Nanohaloarchaea archaeon]|nr:hypothetical protein [Candidatus Nanohaloarchaea archaeon]